MWAAELSPQEGASDHPRGYPVLGVLPHVRKDPLRFFTTISQNYGDVVPLDLWSERVFLINDTEHLHQVLQSNAANYRKSKFSKRLSPMLGDGILISDGDVWRRQKKSSQPAFGSAALEAMNETMVQATDDMLHRWDHSYREGDVVDVAVEMMQLTLDIALRTLFGIRLGADEFARTYRAVTRFLRAADQSLWSPFYVPVGIPTPANQKYREAIHDVDEIVDTILARRQSAPSGKRDLLQFLIDEYGTGEQARRDMRDVMVSMLLASHETTAAALTWSCYLLSRHPSVARRQAEEVQDVLSATPPEYADQPMLPFTKAVFEEAMRLYPPIWSFSRDAIDDDRLGDMRIPAGATVVMCIYAIHRNPNIWENPEGFDPERFLGNSDTHRLRYSYLPFGGGLRTCMGSRFATMEAVIVLSMLAQRYRLEMVPGHPVEPHPMVTLRPRYGMPMRIRRGSVSPS